ncbi:TPA: YqhA family protein [Methanosarcina acetivorans]|uniref:YqhA family protein n=2 Tax=Methanosarcina acetivorans TaxID=2214 RepID=Q8TMK6_METAC|nr:YqhA family protein [Methanosarcina acetivorans]AAM06029.1 conserved hypothetical protein [Methanosarcina acetivorans C2A]HIH94879.1 YqhA family protein [Methanosarcina acetivorans]
MKVVKFIARMRYFVLIPVIGLAITACVLFIKGGVDLVLFMGELVTGMTDANPEVNIIVEIVETVHLFLVGTVLFVTSIGLYQLFIQPLPLPGWLEINDIEELELNLVGLTVVVLGVNFLGVIFKPPETNLAVYGIGYALPIAALAYFIKVRSYVKDGQEGSLKDRSEADSTNNKSSLLSHEKKD